jgi:hypothetical protein
MQEKNMQGSAIAVGNPRQKRSGLWKSNIKTEGWRRLWESNIKTDLRQYVVRMGGGLNLAEYRVQPLAVVLDSIEHSET